MLHKSTPTCKYRMSWTYVRLVLSQNHGRAVSRLRLMRCVCGPGHLQEWIDPSLLTLDTFLNVGTAVVVYYSPYQVCVTKRVRASFPGERRLRNLRTCRVSLCYVQYLETALKCQPFICMLLFFFHPLLCDIKQYLFCQQQISVLRLNNLFHAICCCSQEEIAQSVVLEKKKLKGHKRQQEVEKKREQKERLKKENEYRKKFKVSFSA